MPICCIVGQEFCKKECQLLHNVLFAFDTVRGCKGPSLWSQMEWNGLKMVSEPWQRIACRLRMTWMAHELCLLRMADCGAINKILGHFVCFLMKTPVHIMCMYNYYINIDQGHGTERFIEWASMHLDDLRWQSLSLCVLYAQHMMFFNLHLGYTSVQLNRNVLTACSLRSSCYCETMVLSFPPFLQKEVKSIYIWW